MIATCNVTGDPMAMCTHCHSSEPPPWAGLKINRRFIAKYPGTCCVRAEHVIEQKDRVAFVGLIDEPDDVSLGVACAACTETLQKVRE